MCVNLNSIGNSEPQTGTGLTIGQSEPGLSPYGFRHEESASAPISVKGKGYFGGLATKDGHTATEISSHDDTGLGVPLLVPTLTKAERKHLLDGKPATKEIYDKADSWAELRIKQGKSPFASPTELRVPVNKD